MIFSTKYPSFESRLSLLEIMDRLAKIIVHSLAFAHVDNVTRLHAHPLECINYTNTRVYRVDTIDTGAHRIPINYLLYVLYK